MILELYPIWSNGHNALWPLFSRLLVTFGLRNYHKFTYSFSLGRGFLFHLPNLWSFAFLHHITWLEAWLKAWSCEILLPKVTKPIPYPCLAKILRELGFLCLCSWEEFHKNWFWMVFVSWKLFMRFREACVGFVMFVFHELVKNLMRKVRVLKV